jgi:hypothetical protein
LALFTPKRVVPNQSVPGTPTSSDEPVRKPRVLAISRPVPNSTQVGAEGPISLTQQITPKIPKSQFARIRAWRRYGMSTRQVAKVYGVAVDKIERILR